MKPRQMNDKKHTSPIQTQPAKQPKPKNQTQNNQKMGWEKHTENPSSQKKKKTNLENLLCSRTK
jgi:hypothetical protein